MSQSTAKHTSTSYARASVQTHKHTTVAADHDDVVVVALVQIPAPLKFKQMRIFPLVDARVFASDKRVQSRSLVSAII